MSGRIGSAGRIIQTICEHIATKNTLPGRHIPIRINKPTGFRIVVAAIEVVQPGFGIEIVATVPEGVAVADEGRLGVLRPVRVQNTAIPPCVVCIFYHNRAAAVK